MILKTVKTIALKNSNGGYDIKNISIFRAEDFNVCFSLTHSKSCKGKKVIIKVKCPLCGNDHSYTYCTSDFIRRDLIIGGCEIMGTPLFYLGDENKVKDKINRINKYEKKIYAYI
ncbi:MAG: hypothetical protein ACM3X7_01690 [Solirubrobacterales bacterium]